MMHLVSSAKSKTLERDNVEGKSLTKMRKRTGPRILPCGTPEITGNVGEVDWPIETLLLYRPANPPGFSGIIPEI